jgi:hypothetical protein
MTQVFTISGWVSMATQLPTGTVRESVRRAISQVAVDGAESREAARSKIAGKTLESGSQLGTMTIRWVEYGDGMDGKRWGITVDGREEYGVGATSKGWGIMVDGRVLGDDDEEVMKWLDAVDNSGLTPQVLFGIEAVLD